MNQHVMRPDQSERTEYGLTLTDAQRARLLAALASRLDGEGGLRLVSSASRSQLRNREDSR